MRLLTLDCAQVGHWTAPLRLSLSPRFTVVLGDNEAGKSTLRRALRALLFGPDKALVAPLTVAGFDLAAQLDVGDATCTLHRKGRNLQMALPNDLEALLSSANAGRFASLFDLTHENLFPQDQAFLAADGALGSLMLGARTGVSPTRLQHARQQIEQHLAAADSRRKGYTGIPHFQDQFLEAKRQHDHLARFGESDSRHQQHQALVAQVGELEAKLAKLDAESRRLQGLIDGAADVEQLAHDRQVREALLADGAPPSVAKVTEFSSRLSRVEELAQALAASEVAQREAAAKLDVAEVPGPLHALNEQCEALRDVVASHSADGRVLDEARQRHAQLRGELVLLLERMGGAAGDDSVATARALLRPEPLAAQLRELIAKHAELQNNLETKLRLQAAAQRTLDAIDADDDSASETATDVMDAALLLLEEATEAEREIARLAKARMAARPVLRKQQAALGFASDGGGQEALCPPQAEVAREAEHALAQAQQQLASAQSQSRRRHDELSRLQHQLDERRAQIGSVASADDVLQARALRDARLEALHAALAAADAAKPTSPELVQQAGDLRTLVRQSDLLVDRRMEAGEALGELRASEQQQAQLARQCEDDQAEVDRAAAAESQARQVVAALWPFLPQPPASSAAWLAQYESWRAACESHQQDEQKQQQCHEALATARADALALLADSLPQLKVLTSAQALQDAVTRERDSRRVLAGRIEARQRQRRDAGAILAAEDDAVNAAKLALTQWQAQWDAATRELPDDLVRHPVAIDSWLALQESLRRTLVEIDKSATDVAGRSAALAQKRQRIDALVDAARELEPSLVVADGLEPAAAFAQVGAACSASASRLSSFHALERDHLQASREVEGASAAHASAHAALMQDWAAAGIRDSCNRETLETMDARARKLEAIDARIATTESSLKGRWGSGMSAAIDELASSSVAVLEIRRHDIATELEQTRAERDAAADARRDVQKALDAMQHGHDATAVAQALADARDALFDKVEERLRLRVAQLILERAQRDASDGGQSLAEMASDYFRTLTGGAYSGLRISDDDSSEPSLVAVESARNEKPLGHLSAGTRDQIWLALRLAGIVAAAKETPFPLLLDDSLVQFDDIRAKAAIQLLHHISEHVQVILFTHHDHVAALAEAVVPASDLAVVVLPEVSGAMRQRSTRSTVASRRARPVSLDRSEGENWPTDADGDGPAEGVGARQLARGVEDAEEIKLAILAVLESTSQPMGKSAIIDSLAASGTAIESTWSMAINGLLEDGRVKKEGERRGAKYLLTSPK